MFADKYMYFKRLKGLSLSLSITQCLLSVKSICMTCFTDAIKAKKHLSVHRIGPSLGQIQPLAAE